VVCLGDIFRVDFKTGFKYLAISLMIFLIQIMIITTLAMIIF